MNKTQNALFFLAVAILVGMWLWPPWIATPPYKEMYGQYTPERGPHGHRYIFDTVQSLDAPERYILSIDWPRLLIPSGIVVVVCACAIYAAASKRTP